MQERRVWKPHPQTIVSAGLVVIFAWAIAEAWSWPLRTRFFPMIVGVSMLVLAVVQLAKDVLRWMPAGEAQGPQRLAPKPGAEAPSAAAEGPESGQGESAVDEEPVLVRISLRETAMVGAQFLSFFVAMAVLGFLASISLYTALYLRWVGQVSWGRSVVAGVALGLISWAFFERFLHLPLPTGVLGQLG